MDVVIYVPPGLDAMRSRWDCRDYCIRRGYRIVALAHDPAAVEAMWRRGQMDRVVVARPAHLRMLTHAVDVVSEQVYRPAPHPRRPQRPQRLYEPGQPEDRAA